MSLNIFQSPNAWKSPNSVGPTIFGMIGDTASQAWKVLRMGTGTVAAAHAIPLEVAFHPLSHLTGGISWGLAKIGNVGTLAREQIYSTIAGTSPPHASSPSGGHH